MITYFDTSALVKKYNAESKSNEVIKLWNQTDEIYTSVITLAELLAVFGRKLQDNDILHSDYDKIIFDLELDWQSFHTIHVTNDVLKILKTLTLKHHLRGFDAIHLASAVQAKILFNEPDFVFACYDKQLSAAAKEEKFKVMEDLDQI